MPQIKVEPSSSQLIINGSGNRGKNSLDASYRYPSNLSNGGKGENGEDSRDITLCLSRNKEKNIIEIDVLGVGFYTLPLHGKIIVKANGGYGGNGGNGGNGLKGARGSDGWDASQYSYSRSGENGKPGSNGGNGGDGGNGGKAGRVTIKVNEKDQDLVKLVDIEMKGGDGGYGGSRGEAGQGGPGGQGGRGCSWTEVSVYVNPNGSTERHSFLHSKMGAPEGSVGAPGLPGQPGRKGKRGEDGTLNVIVEKNILESLPKQEPIPSAIENQSPCMTAPPNRYFSSYLPSQQPASTFPSSTTPHLAFNKHQHPEKKHSSSLDEKLTARLIEIEDEQSGEWIPLLPVSTTLAEKKRSTDNVLTPDDTFEQSIASLRGNLNVNPEKYEPAIAQSFEMELNKDDAQKKEIKPFPKPEDISILQPPQKLPGSLSSGPLEKPITTEPSIKRISHTRLAFFNDLLNSILLCKIHDSKEKIARLPQDVPHERLAIESIIKSDIVDLKPQVKHTSQEGLIPFENPLLYQIQPKSKAGTLCLSSCEIYNPPKEKDIIELKIFDKKPIFQEDKSSLLGQTIIDSLDKDMKRYLAKGRKNLKDVHSEEYQRKFFTDECKYSILNANNEPKQIKIALERLKAKILKLEVYYSWGSFFSPQSVKKIDELLHGFELIEVEKLGKSFHGTGLENS